MRLKAYGYAWVTLIFFVLSIIGHWLFGWFAYVDEQQLHNGPIRSRNIWWRWVAIRWKTGSRSSSNSCGKWADWRSFYTSDRRNPKKAMIARRPSWTPYCASSIPRMETRLFEGWMQSMSADSQVPLAGNAPCVAAVVPVD
jgi:hypothetical protein